MANRAITVINFDGLEEQLSGFADDRDWAQFHTAKNLAMALTGEVGELCELLQWRNEEEIQLLLETPDFRSAFSDELADVLIYVVRLATVCGVDLSQAVETKLIKNEDRYPADVVRGSATKRP